jgi:AraC-like DNA-binding protein
MTSDWLRRINPQVHHTGHLPFGRGVINPLRVICDHELFMFSSGESRLVFGEEEYACPKGTYLIIPPGREHVSYALTDEIHVFWTHFDWVHRAEPPVGQMMSFRPAQRSRPRLRRAPSFVPAGVIHGRVESARAFDLHARLCEEWASGHTRRRAVSRALLLGVLLELLEPRAGAATGALDEAGLAERARAYLTALAHRPFRQMPRLKDGMRSLGRSYYHIEHAFRRQYGIAPSEYVAALRIERAKAALRDADRTIGDVARELGFDDAAYFSRYFKRHALVGPRAFRCGEGRER